MSKVLFFFEGKSGSHFTSFTKWEVMGSDMPPDGRCLPQAFSVYWCVLDALQAGPRWLRGVWGNGERLQTPRSLHPFMRADLLADGEEDHN